MPQSEKPNIGQLHQKMIEILGSIVYEQNRQLLTEIGNDLNIPIIELQTQFLTHKQQFYDQLLELQKEK